MAKKTNLDETAQERDTRLIFDQIGDLVPRPEKVAWNKKATTMSKLITSIRPLEDQILELLNQKQPIMDEISELRKDMVNTCIHPSKYLLLKSNGIVVCKFCNKQFKINLSEQ